MDLPHASILFGAGLIAGFINVVAGGGSMLTVPAMLMLGIPPPVANGTNRIPILVQNLVAVVTFFRKGYSDFKLSFKLLLCALPGTILGAWLGPELKGGWFDRTLAIIMCTALVLMWVKRKNAKPDNAVIPETISPQRHFWGYLLMVCIGFYGGFIQIGVSLLLMPLLHFFFGMDLVRVNMHKVFIICGYTVVALAIFAWRVEDIRWAFGLVLAAGTGIGGFVGARMSLRGGERFIHWLFQFVLIAIVIKLLFFPESHH